MQETQEVKTIGKDLDTPDQIKKDINKLKIESETNVIVQFDSIFGQYHLSIYFGSHEKFLAFYNEYIETLKEWSTLNEYVSKCDSKLTDQIIQLDQIPYTIEIDQLMYYLHRALTLQGLNVMMMHNGKQYEYMEYM